MLPRSIMADVSDEDQLASGQDRTGLLFALLTVTHKFGQALSIGIVYFALDMIGFKPGSADNSIAALSGVTTLYGFVPMSLYLLAALTARAMQLTPQRHAQIRAEIEARRVIGSHA